MLKIKTHGICGNVADWTGEWFDRKQTFVLNCENSRLQDVLSGVPQGYIFGPTLFLMFVNDIDAVISSHIQKIEDDCKVYRSVPTTQDIETLQQDINNLCKWSRDWQMLFNVKKWKVLHIGHNNAYHNYSMNGENFRRN